jgi:hypothetical protein
MILWATVNAERHDEGLQCAAEHEGAQPHGSDIRYRGSVTELMKPQDGIPVRLMQD